MAKLYPPILEGTLPAFYGTELTVPFSLNPAVSIAEIKDISIKIRTVQSNIYILTETNATEKNLDTTPCTAKFNFSEQAASKLNVGQYYKIQIAFKDNTDTPGFYSTVGIIKYTTEPSVEIEGLTSEINNHKYKYKGKYSTADKTEKIYTYRFDLYDNSQLISTSGDLIHNNALDQIQGQSQDTYEFNQELELNKMYYIQYSVITTNGIKKSSIKYKIIQSQFIDPMINATIEASLDRENGCVILQLLGEENTTGNFKIVRSKVDTNQWQELFNFVLESQKPSVYNWKDYNVEQGATYIYALQQYNSYNIDSNKSLNTQIQVDFEHMYLSDGERQLKIKYNPKVTSFKETILETRTNTIGSKYPFIFRNGHVRYKEFPISGLISCLADEDFLFMDTSKHDNSIDLIAQNIAVERDFKLEVLEWLNNGKPKVFRSPTEGNYIVRLMNVSMSPIDTLGRMLHTFSATAIEVADYDEKTLIEYGFLSLETQEIKYPHWRTLNLTSGINLLSQPAISLQFNDVKVPIQIDIDSTNFLVEGNYTVDIQDKININSVIVNTSNPTGTLTYGYYLDSKTRFDLINNYSIQDSQSRQFIGETNIINEIEDIKTGIQHYYFIRCYLRPVTNLYTSNDINFYINESMTTSFSNYNQTDLYKVNKGSTIYYMDGEKNKLDSYNTFVNFDNISMDLSKTKEFEVKDLEYLSSFSIGNGVIAEIVYRQQTIDYIYETQDSAIISLKDEVNNNYQTLLNAINSETDVEVAENNYKVSYNDFIIALKDKIDIYEKE